MALDAQDGEPPQKHKRSSYEAQRHTNAPRNFCHDCIERTFA